MEEHCQAWLQWSVASRPGTPTFPLSDPFGSPRRMSSSSTDDDEPLWDSEDLDKMEVSDAPPPIPVQLRSPSLHRHFRLQPSPATSSSRKKKKKNKQKGFVPLENVASWRPPAPARSTPGKSPRRALADLSASLNVNPPPPCILNPPRNKKKDKHKKKATCDSVDAMDCSLGLPDVPSVGFLHKFVDPAGSPTQSIARRKPGSSSSACRYKPYMSLTAQENFLNQ